MAIACLVLRAPCLPSRTCSISSRTNSPACVVGALPSRASLRARSTVFFSGIGKNLESATAAESLATTFPVRPDIVIVGNFRAPSLVAEIGPVALIEAGSIFKGLAINVENQALFIFVYSERGPRNCKQLVADSEEASDGK